MKTTTITGPHDATTECPRCGAPDQRVLAHNGGCGIKCRVCGTWTPEQ